MNILSMSDRALVAYIVANGAGTVFDTWPAKRSEVKSEPCTICFSHGFQPCPDTPYAGNFEVEAFIEVRNSGIIEANQGPDEPRIDADARIKAVFNLFLTPVGDSSGEGIGAAITQAGRESGDLDLQAFTVQNCRIIGGTQGFNSRVKEQRGNVWIEILHLELTVCPSDVS